MRYEPPEGLTPAEVGVVWDESADLEDVTATILDLAVRGHLETSTRAPRWPAGIRGTVYRSPSASEFEIPEISKLSPEF